MRVVLTFLLALIFTGTIGQRRTAPTNLPSPNSAAYSKVGWYRSDSAVLLGIRNDTNWTPITPALIPYKIGGADTSFLTFWDGKKWVIMASQASAAGSVTSLGYRPGDFVDTFYYTNANGSVDWYYSPIVSGLLSGGDISRIGISLNYAITLAVYRIGRTLYISPADTVTIAARDSLPRIDVFYADTNSLVGVLTGTPDSFPLKPSIDVASQVELGFVYVPAIGDTTGDLNVPNFVLFGMGNKINGEFQFAYDSTTNTVLITGDQDRFELNGDQWYHANSSGDLRTAFLKRGGSGLTTAGNIWRWGELTIRPSLRGGTYGTVVFGNDEVFESGIGFPALKHVGIYTDEVERLTVDSVGRVYIKTTPRDTTGFKLLTIDPNSGEIMQTDPVSNVDTCDAITSIGTITKSATTPYVCYDVPDVFFAINCTQYFAAADSVCIQPPSPDSLGRFDVIYADTLGNIGVIEGTVDSFPVIPNVDPSYQIFITAILVQLGQDTAQTLQVPNNVLYGKNNLGQIFGDTKFNYADSLNQVGIGAYPYSAFVINNDNRGVRLKVGRTAAETAARIPAKIWLDGDLLITESIKFEKSGWQRRQIINDPNARTLTITGDISTGVANTGNNLNFVGVYDSMTTAPLVFSRGLNQFVMSINSSRRAILIPRVSASRLANMKQYGNAVQDNFTWTLQEGMIAFDATNKNLVFSRDTGWVSVTGSGGGGGACDTCITNISYRSGDNVDTLFYTDNTGNTDWYYVITRDGLMSGGIVTYSGFDRMYYVSAALYRKGGAFYTTNDTTIVLPALASPDSSRTDVFVVNTSGQTTTIQGVESANPLTPQIDPETDVYLTHVTLTAANPDAGVDTTIIYDENVEWTGTASGVTVNFGNTSNVYRGTYATDVGAINNGDFIQFANGSFVNQTQYAGISMFIRLKQSMPNNNNLFVSFYNGSTQVSSEVQVPLVKTLVGAYQGVSIAMSAFSFTNSLFDRVRIRYGGSGAGITGLYLDFVYLQNGIAPVIINPGTNYVQNIQRVGNDIQQQINNLYSTRFSIGDKVDTTTAIYAGDGLVGGGTLSASRTLRVDTTQVANRIWVTDRLAGYMVNPMTTTGDIIYASDANGTPARLSVGNTDQVLSVTGGIPAWKNKVDSIYRKAGQDSIFFLMAGTERAIKDSAGSSSGGTVTSVATNTATGITGGTITTTGTLAIDTFLISTRAWRDKLADSLGAIIATKGSGTVTTFSSGNLSPLFTTSVATAGTTPSQTFTLSNAGSYTVFGNQTNASAAPSYAKLNINTIDATGTPSATTYLRGDGSWQTISSGGIPIDSVAIRRYGLRAFGFRSWNGGPVASAAQGVGNGTGGLGDLAINDSSNIAIGYLSMNDFTSGYRNTAIGSTTMRYGTTALENVAIGNKSLGSNSASAFSGSRNVAVGYESMPLITTGTGNVGFGWAALSSLTTGSGNIAAGEDAGRLISTGTYNVAVGYRAVYTSNGGSNVGIGYRAFLNGTGSSNIAIGQDALSSTSSSGANIGIGVNTLSASTGGSNIAIGNNAATNSNTGIYNIHIYQKVSSGSGIGGTATRVVDIGGAFSSSSSTGNDNLFVVNVGNNAAISKSTATGQVILGTIGFAGVATGANSNGDYVTAVGSAAGYNTSAQSNTNGTFIGTGAGIRAGGANNTYIGYYTGANSTTTATGTANLAIGYQAQTEPTTGSRNISIGAYAKPGSATSSDWLSIGSGNGATLRWLISDLNSTRRQWKINGTNTDISSTTTDAMVDFAGDRPLILPKATGTAIEGITAVDGMIIYITATSTIFTSVGVWARENGVWVKL